ncbi:MAG: hemerythrin domain-containing protein [Conexivisphaera sp.]
MVTEELQGEHALIILNLGALEVLGPTDEELEFLERCADGCHHAKEELVLFPALVRLGIGEDALVELALEQHGAARRLLAEIRESRSAGAAARYAELIRKHVEMEDSVTYAVAEYAIPDYEKARVLESIAAISRDRCVGFREAAARLGRGISATHISGDGPRRAP